MKRIILLFCVFSVMLLCFSFVSCNEKEPTEKSIEKIPAFVSEYNASLDSLTKHSFKDFERYTCPRNIISNAATTWHTLGQFHNNFPVQRLVPMGEDHVCAVYLVETDEENTAYVYVIFKLERKASSESLSGWDWIGEFYFVSRPLSSSNFALAKIGDSASEIAKIDPSLMLDIRNLPFSAFTGALEKGYDYFTSYKLLTDGVMLLDFRAPKQDGKIRADFENFTLVKKTFYPHDSFAKPYNVSVLGYPNLLQEN